jgi:methylase of polypeptide subunit release factors
MLAIRSGHSWLCPMIYRKVGLVITFAPAIQERGVPDNIVSPQSDRDVLVSTAAVATLNVHDIVRALGYAASENWLAGDNDSQENAHLRRRAHEAGITGTYSFRTAPEHLATLPRRAAVHVAEADTVDQARNIHQKLWNLGDAPFLLVVLPDQVRVYTAFRYEENEDQPLLSVPLSKGSLNSVAKALADFHAHQIDSGRIWERWGDRLPISSRVDQRLLDDLNELGRLLIDDRKLLPEVAHALVGKFIYIRYLVDRDILSERWLGEHGITREMVLGPEATVLGLSRLVDALERRFNGRIFPLPLSGEDAPDDDDVAFVASVFRGDSPGGQIALNFKIYDFFYIPIELLSSIYEHFLHAQGRGQKVGAYYTSEPLAEYLLSEVNAVLPLQAGYRILDPCCGSGVFLVLAYRRLIEKALNASPNGKLGPAALRDILVHSIYGVERNIEACYVAEFSLILTMLSYIDPPELHRNKRFKFPNLHGTQIVNADFFDAVVEQFFTRGLRFDWIIGNPPWVEIDPSDQEEEIAVDWIRVNAATRPVARFRVCEAFTWRAPDLLSSGGYVGFVVHAKSLTNDQSAEYRRRFFTSHEVVRMTNFSNLANTLFKGRATAPAATIVYRQADTDDTTERAPIIHYSPFVINQLPIRGLGSKQSWVITIYENEITAVDPMEAASGAARTWKMALWGTYRDEALIKRLERHFPNTLEQFCDLQEWAFGLGVQLRDEEDERSGSVIKVDGLTKMKVLDFDAMNASGQRFEVPKEALRRNKLGFLRKRGGKKGLRLIEAPHLVITPAYAAFSDIDFVVKHPRVAVAGKADDADHLRALSVYLNCNIARYLAFFSSTRWGVDRITGGYVDIAAIRVPTLDAQQIEALASIHADCSRLDGTSVEDFNLFNQDVSDHSRNLTSEVAKILRLPPWVGDVVDEFISVRLSTNNGKTNEAAAHPPRPENLAAYASTLRQELDAYAKISHRVSIREMSDFIVCEVDVNASANPLGDNIVASEEKLWRLLRSAQTQWVYIQRSLRVIDGDRMYLYKPKRLIDWTRTQALLDSDDIIAEVLAHVGRRD